MPRAPLYYHADLDVYECMGCYAMIEVPRSAVIRAGHSPEPIKTNPENRMLWLEMIEIDHMPCGQFSDSKLAEQARMYRNPILAAAKRHDPYGPRPS